MKMFRFAAIAMISVAPMVAKADPRDDSLSAVQRCTLLSDSQARLNCYDQAAPPRGGSAAPAAVTNDFAPQAPPQRRAPHQDIFESIFGNAPRAPQVSVAQFGSESLQTDSGVPSSAYIRGDAVNSITARMTAYSLTPTGVMTVTLDNGQVWRQISGSAFAHLVKPPGDYRVRINRGSFAPYKMTISGISAVFDVRRAM